MSTQQSIVFVLCAFILSASITIARGAIIGNMRCVNDD